ncbi:SurA N-terminal domain-containing protein [Paradonghicola geojensis]|jgi:peptidyl-prolyl cis-trans isomerase D|nr:SurA N-terminal domain-containing protein [Marivivens geojensis]
MAREKKTKLGVWVILGLLFFSLVGFGTTSLSGRTTTLATVGDKEITLNQYALELRRGIDTFSGQIGQPLSFTQAQSLGIDQQVLNDMINMRLFENEATNMGVSIGDQRLRDRVTSNPNFQGFSGTFDREAYRDVLSRMGTRESDYEQSLRDEMAATALQIGLTAGYTVPAGYIDALVTYAAERRDITWVQVTDAALTDAIPAPTEEDLAAYHEGHPADFTTLETKSIVYAALTPDMLLPTIEVDEAALRDLYAQRTADYNSPERRLVERLGFADEASAQAAMDAITAGETDFDQLVEDRGLTLDDVDLGDVDQVQLAEAGAAVFAAASGDVVGPLPSLIGPALFRINAVLEAESIPFEVAADELRAELGRDRARRVIGDAAEQMADLIAGGARVEDLADQTQMELGSIDWTVASTDGMAAYPEFRQAAAAAQIGAYPELIEMSDGGIFALRVETIQEPALQPLEDVLEDVTAAWTRDTTQAAILAKAEEMATALSNGSQFGEFGLAPTIDVDVTRQTFLDYTPEGFMTRVFETEAGNGFALPYDGGAVLARVDAVNAPNLEDPDVIALRDRFAAQLSNGVAQDAMQITLNTLRGETDINVVREAVNAVHAQIQ